MFDEADELPPEYQAALAKVAKEMLALGDGDAIIRRFGKYRDDPIGFFRNELGVDPWESEDPEQAGQGDVLRAVGVHDRVGVKSGHKCSKSLSASGLALWWVCTRTGARAVITAPTFNQVKGIIWRELRARFRERDLESKLGASLPLDPSTGLQLPNGNEIVGLSTKTPENLAGISAPNLLFIIDEGSGFPDELFEVIMGNSAGGSKIFVITNPTRTSGWFFELFRKRMNGWVLLTISSENTPNARTRTRLIPGLATYEWVEEMRALCSTGGYPENQNDTSYLDDATYMVRVRGEFPPQGTDAVIGVRQTERANAGWKIAVLHREMHAELVLGVDCARYGNDDNVIQPVRGLYAYMPEAIDAAIARNNSKVTAGGLVADGVIRIATSLRNGSERVRVNIDGIGVGSAVVDALKLSEPVQHGWMYLVEINVGESADEANKDPDDKTVTHYANLRSQVWFGVATWLHEGGVFPEHERLGGELLAATYSFDERGRKRVEKKEKMRAALNGKSPDYADALCLATYRGNRGGLVDYSYTSAGDSRHSGGSDSGGSGRGGSFNFF